MGADRFVAFAAARACLLPVLHGKTDPRRRGLWPCDPHETAGAHARTVACGRVCVRHFRPAVEKASCRHASRRVRGGGRDPCAVVSLPVHAGMGLADPKICIHRRFLCLCVDRSVQRAGSARGELGARDAHGARHILPCLGNGIYRACGGAFRTRLLPQCKDAARRAVFVRRVYDRHDLHLRTLHARALSVPGAPAPAHGVSFGTGSSHPSLLRRVYGVDPAQCAGGDVYRGSPERARRPVQRESGKRRRAARPA